MALVQFLGAVDCSYHTRAQIYTCIVWYGGVLLLGLGLRPRGHVICGCLARPGGPAWLAGDRLSSMDVQLQDLRIFLQPKRNDKAKIQQHDIAIIAIIALV